MRVHLRRPSTDILAQRADEQSELPLTYEPVGVTASDVTPDGYRRSHWTRVVGSGPEDFAAAVASLRSWGLQTGSGLAVAADGDVATGVVVAMAAPLPVGWIEVVCRVVDVTDGVDDWSFTYGTLPEHPEQGEERFTVSRLASGDVRLDVVAVSRSRNTLARLAPPIARVLQERAIHRYFGAMERAVQDNPGSVGEIGTSRAG